MNQRRYPFQGVEAVKAQKLENPIELRRLKDGSEERALIKTCMREFWGGSDLLSLPRCKAKYAGERDMSREEWLQFICDRCLLFEEFRRTGTLLDASLDASAVKQIAEQCEDDIFRTNVREKMDEILWNIKKEMTRNQGYYDMSSDWFETIIDCARQTVLSVQNAPTVHVMCADFVDRVHTKRKLTEMSGWEKIESDLKEIFGGTLRSYGYALQECLDAREMLQYGCTPTRYHADACEQLVRNLHKLNDEINERRKWMRQFETDYLKPVRSCGIPDCGEEPKSELVCTLERLFCVYMTSVYYRCHPKPYISYIKNLDQLPEKRSWYGSMEILARYLQNLSCKRIAPLIVYHYFANLTSAVAEGRLHRPARRSNRTPEFRFPAMEKCEKTARVQDYTKGVGRKAKVNIGLFGRLLKELKPFFDFEEKACRFGFYYTTSYSALHYCLSMEITTISKAELCAYKEKDGLTSEDRVEQYNAYDDEISSTDPIDTLGYAFQYHISHCLNNTIDWLVRDLYPEERNVTFAAILLQDLKLPNTHRIMYAINQFIPDEKTLQRRVDMLKSKMIFVGKDMHAETWEKIRTLEDGVKKRIDDYEKLLFEGAEQGEILDYLDVLIDEGDLLRRKEEYEAYLLKRAERQIRFFCRHVLESVLKDRVYAKCQKNIARQGARWFSLPELFTVVPPCFEEFWTNVNEDVSQDKGSYSAE